MKSTPLNLMPIQALHISYQGYYLEGLSCFAIFQCLVIRVKAHHVKSVLRMSEHNIFCAIILYKDIELLNIPLYPLFQNISWWQAWWIPMQTSDCPSNYGIYLRRWQRTSSLSAGISWKFLHLGLLTCTDLSSSGNLHQDSFFSNLP